MATIVIIDDSFSVRTHIRQALEGSGHQIVEAENGTAGYEKIVEVRCPDLVITDYNMPGLDGIAMLTKVSETLGGFHFPVCMLTTETSVELKAASKKVGVMAWVIKPVSSEKMRLVIEKLLTVQRAT